MNTYSAFYEMFLEDGAMVLVLELISREFH